MHPENGKHKHESDCKPCENRSIGFIIVDSKFLLHAMGIELSLVLSDFIGGQFTLVSGSPY